VKLGAFDPISTLSFVREPMIILPSKCDTAGLSIRIVWDI
jgi:hypothetical protein